MGLVTVPMPFNGYIMMIFIYKTNEKKISPFWKVMLAVSKLPDVPPKLR
jgi:hypothetical protein